MQADALSQTFAALADPTRRAILKRAGGGTREREGQFWDASFDRLGAYLKQLQHPTGGRHARRRKR